MYKGLQSAGSAIIYQLDTWEVPYMTLLISNWVMLPLSLIIAAPVAYYMVHEHSEDASLETSANCDMESADQLEDKPERATKECIES